ncbi:MAG: hypothetical protein JO063_04260 [Pseudonocardiales bacterium]|nr:hypothetical protein [Pseudonocardiales bacterium]
MRAPATFTSMLASIDDLCRKHEISGIHLSPAISPRNQSEIFDCCACVAWGRFAPVYSALKEIAVKVALGELEKMAKKAILRHGCDEAGTRTVLRVLMHAQLQGNNQGVVKLIGLGIPIDPAAKPLFIEKEALLSALVDGGDKTRFRSSTRPSM